MLNDRLTSTLMLTLLEDTKGFVMYCDSSRVGSGCLFMHYLKVIAYDLRKLKVDERNYHTHDLELEVVVFALKILMHHLYWVHVNVFNDHRSLK